MRLMGQMVFFGGFVMKKMLLFVLALLMALTPALAAPQLSDSLFSVAKRAAEKLMTGDYDDLAGLPFSGDAPSADEWASFAGNYHSSGHAQQKYAVGYWTGDSWRIAVPIETPDSPDVEVLLLSSDDGCTFSGYRYADWGRVVREYAGSDHVVWNGEYIPATPKVYAD